MGILLVRKSDGTYDIAQDADGKMQRGDTYMQEVELILMTNPGELKCDPLAGVGIVRMMNAKISQSKIQDKVRIQLTRDGKNYDEIKGQINIRSNNQ